MNCSKYTTRPVSVSLLQMKDARQNYENLCYVIHVYKNSQSQKADLRFLGVGEGSRMTNRYKDMQATVADMFITLMVTAVLHVWC